MPTPHATRYPRVRQAPGRGGGLDEEALRSLAERLLQRQTPGDNASVGLWLGDLPPAVTVAPPLPSRARLLGSVLYSRQRQPLALEAVLDVDGDPPELLAEYAEYVEGLGWTDYEPFGAGHGFLPSPVRLRRFRRDAQVPLLTIELRGRTEQPFDVRVRLDWEHPPFLFAGPHAVLLEARRMPPLVPPSHALVRLQGASGGDGRWTSEASIETLLAIDELHTHFARQLREAGWTPIVSRVDDVLAWSTWHLADTEEWDGFLLIAAFKAGQLQLLLRVEKNAHGSWS